MNLAVFGDSWPVGVELSQGESPFGNLLHKKMKTKNFHNMAEQGSTIDSLVIQLNKFANKDIKNCLCIFLLLIQQDIYTSKIINQKYYDPLAIKVI